MRVLLDACVLFPTVLREILLGAGEAGLFQPLWSDRILQEWARAVAAKLPDQTDIARAEIALLRTRWPGAMVVPEPLIETGLYLPDPNDVHVLAVAIGAAADTLVTFNLKDFPTRTLAAHGILRRDPDGFLVDLWQDHPDAIAEICERVCLQADRLSPDGQTVPGLLKRARLPRLRKALDRR